jgi:ABC-type phosphate/phosphonate transport system substrate-binding protein
VTRAAALAIVLILAGCAPSNRPSLVMVVSDPLAKETASECVRASAVRDYSTVAARLSVAIHGSGSLVFCASDNALVERLRKGDVDIGGATTWALLEASSAAVRPFVRVADLPPSKGSDDLTGVFIARASGPIRTLADLNGKKVVMGPDSAYEKSLAARELLKQDNITVASVSALDACIPVAAAVLEQRADAGVISSYVADFGGLTAVGDPSLFREIARTKPLPFITVGIRGGLDRGLADTLRRALLGMSGKDVPEDLFSTGFTAPAPWSPGETKP